VRPAETTPRGGEILARMRRRALAERIPIAGTFELTARCNLRCGHCYLGAGELGPAASGELPVPELDRLIGEAVAAGCLDIILTGGEPLLRPDFHLIYRQARELGALVTVFTNGTLVRDHHVALFRELPPAAVEVSLYGATPETYEAVTGVEGGFERCLAGIGSLVEGGIRVVLKSVVLRQNQAEIPAMEEMARSLGVPFRMDPVICPRLDGDPAPLAGRVDPGLAARLQYADPAIRQRTRSYLERATPLQDGETVYQCDAGVVAFYVTAGGRLRPCVMTTDMEFDARGMGFEAAWQAATRAVGKPAWKPGDTCRACPDLPICGFCPALLRLEKGSATSHSDYLCQLGRARRAAIEADGHQGREGVHAS
jgi:radical SAM protein with 4Fe4S-binding SPASM domain